MRTEHQQQPYPESLKKASYGEIVEKKLKTIDIIEANEIVSDSVMEKVLKESDTAQQISDLEHVLGKFSDTSNRDVAAMESMAEKIIKKRGKNVLIDDFTDQEILTLLEDELVELQIQFDTFTESKELQYRDLNVDLIGLEQNKRAFGSNHEKLRQKLFRLKSLESQMDEDFGFTTDQEYINQKNSEMLMKRAQEKRSVLFHEMLKERGYNTAAVSNQEDKKRRDESKEREQQKTNKEIAKLTSELTGDANEESQILLPNSDVVGRKERPDDAKWRDLQRGAGDFETKDAAVVHTLEQYGEFGIKIGDIYLKRFEKGHDVDHALRVLLKDMSRKHTGFLKKQSEIESFTKRMVGFIEKNDTMRFLGFISNLASDRLKI